MRLSIRTPKDVNHSSMVQELTDLLSSGVKTSEIKLELLYVTSDKEAKKTFDTFNVLKNKIAFKIR